MWQQTVKAKIKNQAAMLKHAGKSDEALLFIASQVKSGDTTNEEAQAARRYCKKLNYFWRNLGETMRPFKCKTNITIF